MASDSPSAVVARTSNVPEIPLSTKVAIEALGSFFIVLVGLAAGMFINTPATVGMAYGLALIAGLIAFGKAATGYFNPALSLALAVAGRIKWAAALLFIVAQTVGAFAGALVLYGVVKVMPEDATGGVAKVFGTLANGFDAESPAKIPMVGVLIVEIVLMLILVALLLGVTSPSNNSVLAPLGMGVAVMVAMTISLPISNGSLNPARATSVVFLADGGAVGQLWLFWLAPLFAAALAAALYRTFRPAEVIAVETALIEDAEEGSVAEATASSSVTVDPGAPARAVPAAKPGPSDAQNFFDSPSNKG